MTTDIEIYIVVLFGCNSIANHMWVPKTYIFINREEAFEFYKNHAPSLEDVNNRAKIQPIYHPNYDNEYIIECIMQVHGYIYGDRTCSEKPYGAKISRHIIKI